MTLDFQRLAAQLDDLGPDLRSQGEEASRSLARALDAMRAWARRPDDLRRRLAEASTSWRPAEPLGEPLDAAFDAPPPPMDYVALATDGSHIDVERHNPLPCYLLNVGWARIRYGRSPDAELANQPELAYGDQRLALSDPVDASRQAPVRGNLLAAVRAVREVETLAELAAGDPRSAVDPELPTLALVDGTFLLWGLAREEITASVKRYLLDEGMIPALDRLQTLARERTVLPAGYVSRPDRAEVVHSLRLAVCPLARVDCRACPRQPDEPRPCDDVGVATDRQLFSALLAPGQRSAVFARQPTPGSIEAQYYGEHRPATFYLRTPADGADEIACVEVPLWLARDGERRPAQRVTLLHSLLLDQCRRNMGYPLALMEAHEQAVITWPERESFRLLLESQVAAEGLAANTSAKAMSKRGRWL